MRTAQKHAIEVKPMVLAEIRDGCQDSALLANKYSVVRATISRWAKEDGRPFPRGRKQENDAILMRYEKFMGHYTDKDIARKSGLHIDRIRLHRIGKGIPAVEKSVYLTNEYRKGADEWIGKIDPQCPFRAWGRSRELARHVASLKRARR